MSVVQRGCFVWSQGALRRELAVVPQLCRVPRPPSRAGIGGGSLPILWVVGTYGVERPHGNLCLSGASAERDVTEGGITNLARPEENACTLSLCLAGAHAGVHLHTRRGMKAACTRQFLPCAGTASLLSARSPQAPCQHHCGSRIPRCCHSQEVEQPDLVQLEFSLGTVVLCLRRVPSLIRFNMETSTSIFT